MACPCTRQGTARPSPRTSARLCWSRRGDISTLSLTISTAFSFRSAWALSLSFQETRRDEGALQHTAITVDTARARRTAAQRSTTPSFLTLKWAKPRRAPRKDGPPLFHKQSDGRANAPASRKGRTQTMSGKNKFAENYIKLKIECRELALRSVPLRSPSSSRD